MRQLLEAKKNVVLDNLFHTAASRRPFIEAAQKLHVPVRAVFMKTSTDDACINILCRMVEHHGRVFLTPEACRLAHDPNIFPAAVIFKISNEWENPTATEGFAQVEIRVFKRRPWKGTNKAVFIDFDGTVRESTGPHPFPTHPSEVKILPVKAKLDEFRQQGYRVLGVTNQSGVAKGLLTEAQVVECIQHTCAAIGKVDGYRYCPHGVPPRCYCRKPQVGMAIDLAATHDLDLSKCIMVGDQTSDKTFAKRLGMGFIYAHTLRGVE
jgi:HAD superfamily hydrolase (TIGR01662 family)